MANLPSFPTQSLYGNFPAFPVNRIGIPEIQNIPIWTINVILWVIGWVGAVFKWSLEWLSDEAINLVEWGTNGATGTLNDIIRQSQIISAQTGIFQPIIAAFLIGGICAIAVFIGMIIINALGKVS